MKYLKKFNDINESIALDYLKDIYLRIRILVQTFMI